VNARRLRSPVFRTLITFGVVLLMLFPIYWLVLTSMLGPMQLVSTDLADLLPHGFNMLNYSDILGVPTFSVWVRNSLVVSISVTVLTVAVSSLGGYGLARFQFRGRRLVGRLLLVAYIAPPVLLALPMYGVLASLGLLNSPLGLIIAQLAFAVPFGLWLLRGYFIGLPTEIEDASLVDGCSRLSSFVRVVLPLSLPGIVACAMFAFLLSWNDYFFPLIFLQSNDQMTLPIGIQSTYFSGTQTPSDWIHLITASVLTSIPVFLLFGGLQRWLVGGLTAGAVRG
jgi:ABC-type glycerol-3-phosphate transport system permease component